ncbi:MAG: peptidylprolyl isomerase [Gammaproteobacteria bacterium]|nr:peptidylprolyl isomerase [Gammaproteobacteria bacterium]
MNRSILIIYLAICLLTPVVLVAKESHNKPVTLVSNSQYQLTDDDVVNVFMASTAEKQKAIISHPKRFQKFIENRWAELNLIEQVKHGEQPESMPDLDLLMKLVRETTIAKMKIQQLAEEQSPAITGAAKKRYQDNQNVYRLPDRVQASHILIKAEKRSNEAAQALAEKIRKQLIAGQDTFESLARQYSEDPSVIKNQGNLGFFGRGQMAKPFEEAAFSLSEPGQISPVVKTQFGYHVIRLEKQQKGKIKDFSAVEPTLRKDILTERQQKLWKQYEATLEESKQNLVSQSEIDAWLWFGGFEGSELTDQLRSQIKTKLGIAKLLAAQANKSGFETQQVVQNKLIIAEREAMIQLRRKALFDQIANRSLSNAVKEHYRLNKQRFMSPKNADISLIYLSKAKHERQKIDEMTKIIMQKIDDKQSFEKMALTYSDTPGVKQNKGHLGLVTPGKLGSQLDKQIFSRPELGILEPVETEEGKFIIMVHQIIPEKQLALDEVRSSIKASLVNELATSEYSELVHSILNDSSNQVNDKAVDQLYSRLKQLQQ